MVIPGDAPQPLQGFGVPSLQFRLHRLRIGLEGRAGIALNQFFQVLAWCDIRFAHGDHGERHLVQTHVRQLRQGADRCMGVQHDDAEQVPSRLLESCFSVDFFGGLVMVILGKCGDLALLLIIAIGVSVWLGPP